MKAKGKKRLWWKGRVESESLPSVRSHEKTAIRSITSEAINQIFGVVLLLSAPSTAISVHLLSRYSPPQYLQWRIGVP